jgi:hypothetical protein
MNAEENKDENKTIKAITDIAKAVPVYQDILQPAAKEIGKGLTTVAKLVNVALAPIKILVWGYDKIEEFINVKVASKLENIKEEDIVTPPPQVVGPALEALRFAGHQETLREMYANLIANAIDKNSQEFTHPGFVEILKSLKPEEGIILNYLATQLDRVTDISKYPIIDLNITNTKDHTYWTVYQNFCLVGKNAGVDPFRTPSFIENLVRLGLLEIHPTETLSDGEGYQKLFESEELNEITNSYEYQENEKLEMRKKTVYTTPLGREFIFVCVKNKSENKKRI